MYSANTYSNCSPMLHVVQSVVGCREKQVWHVFLKSATSWWRVCPPRDVQVIHRGVDSSRWLAAEDALWTVSLLLPRLRFPSSKDCVAKAVSQTSHWPVWKRPCLSLNWFFGLHSARKYCKYQQEVYVELIIYLSSNSVVAIVINKTVVAYQLYGLYISSGVTFFFTN